MQRFRNILVGVDLSHSAAAPASGSAASQLSPDNQEAIHRATWLARTNNARLLFFSVLNLTEKALHHPAAADHPGGPRTVEDELVASLHELVRETRTAG